MRYEIQSDRYETFQTVAAQSTAYLNPRCSFLVDRFYDACRASKAVSEWARGECDISEENDSALVLAVIDSASRAVIDVFYRTARHCVRNEQVRRAVFGITDYG